MYFLCISPGDEFVMSRLISEFRYCQPDLSIIMSLISFLKTNKNPKQGRYRFLSSPLKFPNLPQFNYFSEIFTIVFPVQEPVVNSIEAIFVSGFFHLFTYFYCINMSQFIRFSTKSINESELLILKGHSGETQLPLAPNAFFSPFTPASISGV